MSASSDETSNAQTSFIAKLWKRSKEKCSPNQLDQYANDDGSITKQGWELIHKSTSNSKRLKAIADITHIIKGKQLQVSTLEGIWHTTNDMLDDDSTRTEYIRFLIEMTFSQNDNLGMGLRHSFFLAIKEIGVTDQSIEWLAALLSSSKSLEPFEKDIGPLLAEWMFKEYKNKLKEKRLIALLDISGRLVRENAAHLRIEQLVKIVRICGETMKKNKKRVIPFAVSLLTAIIKFYALPDEILPDFVYMLCITINNDDSYDNSWKLARLALTSINSYVVVKYLEDLINKSKYLSPKDSKEKLSAIRGAAIILSNASWGHKFINAHVRITLSSILENFGYAVMLGPYVGTTIIQTVMRLVEKYFFNLNIVTWNSICNVLTKSLEYCKEYSDYGKFFEDTNHIIDFIASIYGKKHGGKRILVSSNFFDVVELSLTIKSNANLIIGLIDHRIKLITPTNDKWIEKSKELFDKYFNEKYSLNIRIKIVCLLEVVYDKYGLLYEEELIDGLILPSIKNIKKEKQNEIKLKMLNVIFHIAEKIEINNKFSSGANCFSKLFNLISDLFNQPFKKLFELNYETTVLFRLNELVYKRWSFMNSEIANSIINVLNTHLLSFYDEVEYYKKGENCRKLIFELLLSFSLNITTGEIELKYNNIENIEDTCRNNSYIFFDDNEEYNFQWNDICKSIIKAFEMEKSWTVFKIILLKLPNMLYNEGMVNSLLPELRENLYITILEYSNKDVEEILNVSEEVFGSYYTSVVSSMIIYENYEDLYPIFKKYLRLKVPNALKALNSIGNNDLLFLVTRIDDILNIICSIENISEEFIIIVLEFLFDSHTLAHNAHFRSNGKIRVIFNILFLIINNSTNRIILFLAIHTIMKWFSVLDSQNKKLFVKLFNHKKDSLKCIIEDDNNILKCTTDYTSTLISLLSAYFEYWFDISESHYDHESKDLSDYLNKGLKECDSINFVINNTIVTVQNLTGRRIISNSENVSNKNGIRSNINLMDLKTSKVFSEVVPSLETLKSSSFDIYDMETVSEEAKKNLTIKKSFKKIRSASAIAGNSITFADEMSTEYTQIIIRHICGKQVWLLRNFNGIPTDFAGEVNIKQFDHISLVRHLYSNHASKKLIGNEKINTFLRNFDKIKIKEELNVGVLYMGDNQITASSILSNVYGSYRFNAFFKRLGQIIRLNNQNYTKKSCLTGFYAYKYTESTASVTYYVSTLLPEKDNNTEDSLSRRLVTNNSVMVVFNESGRAYKLGTINNQYENVIIEIIPQNSKFVLVNTRISKNLGNLITPIKEYLSDDNAAILVNKLSIRLNLCVKIMESMMNNSNVDDIFMGQGMERLKKIEKFKRLAIMKEKD